MLRLNQASGLCLTLSAALCGVAAKAEAHGRCARISDGTIYSDAGELLTPGFDEWGYNYNAHIFMGGYCDSLHDAESCQAYRDVDLLMKWNDAWLSRTDCDGDGKLDRHFGFESYLGSGAMLANLMHGTYDLDGKECSYLYGITIVAAPADGELLDGVWFDARGRELGREIWGEFAVTHERLVDPCGAAAELALPR